MNEQVKDYLEKYPSEIIDMYNNLRKMIFDSVSCELEEILWAKLPSYYVGESFVRLIPFKDHINIEAQAVIQHKEELACYKITPKGMLQIYLKQDIPYEVLKQIFAETLEQLIIRPYKPKDAEVIVSWIKDERSLRKWSSDRYGAYPITAEDINYKYLKCNGDCEEPDNFYPITAVDANGPVGHLIMRYTNKEKTIIRLGFVIVDDSKRGMGYGKRMIQMAMRYAFDMLKAEKITLGVFDNNPSAYYCYKAAGFNEVPMQEDIVIEIMGEKWKCIELESRKKLLAQNENIIYNELKVRDYEVFTGKHIREN